MKKTKDQLIEETRASAAAFVDDMRYMVKTIIKGDLGPHDIRRISNPIRRILLADGGDIGKIASCRIGAYRFRVPDVLPFVRFARKRPLGVFSLGGAQIFGMKMGPIVAHQGSFQGMPPDFDPDKRVDVPIQGFLARKVLCLENKWISRSEVIKYVAYVASGVHSGPPQTNEHRLLHRLRHTVSVSVENGVATTHFQPSYLGWEEAPFHAHRNGIDIVLIQVIATVILMAESPDIEKLGRLIEAELST